MNRFRRITLATLAGGTAALFGAGAFAGGRRRMHGPMDPAEMDERIEHFVKHFAVEVDATPEQQQKLAAIAKEAAKDLRRCTGRRGRRAARRSSCSRRPTWTARRSSGCARRSSSRPTPRAGA